MNRITVFDGDTGWLSNFYPSRVVIDGFQFSSGEAAFQAQKYPRKDWSQFNGLTPSQAKRLGRKAQLPKDWDMGGALAAMRKVIWTKFGENELGLWLVGTGDTELVEGNTWHDNIWGDCSCKRCRNIEGKNQLGQLLMERREELKQILPQIKHKIRRGGR